MRFLESKKVYYLSSFVTFNFIFLLESGEESFSEDEQENSEMKKRGRNFLKSAPPQIINWLMK